MRKLTKPLLRSIFTKGHPIEVETTPQSLYRCKIFCAERSLNEVAIVPAAGRLSVSRISGEA